MPSSASTQLKLELMANGEKSNQWGGIANTVFQQLEGAIAGYVAITFTTTTESLSVADYTLGSYHNMMFRLGGAPSGTVTWTVPTLEKLYIIDNACGQSVLVKTAAGTGVTILNSRKAIVYCDGTNIVELANAFVTEAGTQTLTNKTLTAPVISSISNGGTVTIPSGADTLVTLTATQTLTNKTLTSPTLNTPTLSGTVSGTFTLPSTATVQGSSVSGNISGNAANVTGTVAVANGGTGATVAATARTNLGAAASGVIASSGLTSSATNRLVGRATAGAGALEEITIGGGLTLTGTTLSTTSGGSVSSVDVSGGTTGLTTSGGPITGTGTITLAGTLAVANGGTGATTAANARSNLSAVGTGVITGSGLTMSTARILGRTTAATGAIEEITIGSGLSLSAGTLSSTAGGGTVTSVGLSVPAFLSVSGSPVTTTGTLAVTYSGTALPVANGGTGVTTSTGSGANVLGTSPTIDSPTFTGTVTFNDNTFTLQDSTDTTKKAQFELASIATATTRTFTLPNVNDTIVTLTATQTLTNKTLTAPVISTISNGGTVTLPSGTETLVGRATTDTLTNKTLTAPVINTQVTGTAVASGSEYRSNTANKIVSVDGAWSAVNEVGLTYAASYTPDMSTFINGNMTLTGNITINAPSNTKVGQSGYIRLVQDATGSRVATWDAVYKFPAGMSKVLTTTATKIDYLYYTVRSSTEIICSLQKDVA